MRKLGLVALTLFLVACASQKTAADQAKDEKLIANALTSADSFGQKFTMQETVKVTSSGVSVPKTADFRAQGFVKNGNVEMAIAITNAQSPLVYDFLVVDDQLYVKPDKATQWRVMPADSADNVYPSVRLLLLRDAVLLAKSESGPSVEHISSGFTHKYVLRPAPDQLEQLQGVAVQGAAETVFLKSAKAEVDVFLTTSGDHLSRTEVHLTGSDQQGTKQQIDSSTDFTGDSTVSQILAPPDAASAPPGQIFSSAPPT